MIPDADFLREKRVKKAKEPRSQGVRVHEEVERCSQRVKCLEVGDWLEARAQEGVGAV